MFIKEQELFMKKTVIFLMILCMLLSVTGCGSASIPTASGQPAPAASASSKEETLPATIALSDEEFVYHGVHMLIPDCFDMVKNESNEHQVYGQWKHTNSSEQNKGQISFFYDDEETYWDVSLDRENAEYSPADSRMYYSEHCLTGRIADYWNVERRRINNIDVVIMQCQNQVMPEKKETSVTIILNSCIVDISITSSSELLDELFDKCIESIWVEDDEVPDIVKNTSAEVLSEAGLNTKTWEYNGLYIHLPVSFIPVDMNDGSIGWFSADGECYISLMLGEAELLLMNEDEVESSALDGLEFDYFRTGNYNNMFCSSGRCTIKHEGQEYSYDWSVFLAEVYGYVTSAGPEDDDTVIVIMAWPKGDEEAEKLCTAAWQSIHFADGWIGEGMLEPDPIPLEEFETMVVEQG